MNGNCKVCSESLLMSICGDDFLTINNVPEDTFYFSDKTIDLRIVRCIFCGAVQLYNVPLSDDYEVVYRSLGTSKDYREDKKKQLNSFLEKYNLQDKKLLEIGCGDGQFLDIFKELNTECDGIEVGNENYAICKEKEYKVIKGNYTSLPDCEGYDAIVSFYYLEHLPFPTYLLETAYKNLKENGILLIEVPNYDHIEKNNIWLEFTKDHLVYYTKRTLSYLLLDAGFEILETNENTGGLCLSVIAKKPECKSFSLMQKEIKDTKKRFKELVDTFEGDFIIYGAGHYSQLLLNNLYEDYGIKPKYIFDSNKVKCGEKICGVTIKYKDELYDVDDCANIIISCGMYNNEVQKMLQNMTLPNIKEIYKWD